MRIPLNDSDDIIFPFDRIYDEQYEFIKQTHKTITSKDGGHCLFEMPHGASVCLISLCLSLQRKLVYAINPKPKLKRLKEEIELCCQAYYQEQQPKDNDGDVKMEDAAVTENTTGTILALCLSSHDQDLLDASLRSNCSNHMRQNIHGVYEDLQHLLQVNMKSNNQNGSHWCCSSCLIQAAMDQADIFVVQYTYLLDSKVSKLMSAKLFANGGNAKGDTTTTPMDIGSSNNDAAAVSSNGGTSKKLSDTIVAFDQAHNIDSICMNILSVTIHSTCLDQATRSLGRISAEISRRKTTTKSSQNNNGNGCNNSHVVPSLQQEYQSLVDTPIDDGIFFPDKQKTSSLFHATHCEDWEPVPGNIRRAEHFIGFLRKIIEYYKVQLRWLTNNNTTKKKGKSGENGNETKTHRLETPLAFLHRLTNATGLEAKALRFTYARLTSLLRTLQITSYPLLDSKSFAPLLAVADLTSLLANYVTDHNSKFTVVTELTHVLEHPYGHTEEGEDHHDPHSFTQVGEKVPTLQFVCLDASLALKPVLERFRTVILHSTAMSPLEVYPKILQFTPALIQSFPMSFSQNCMYPMIVARGSDQIAISTKTSDRASLSVVRNYGSLLVELCSIVPDGVVAYFPSYSYMESLLQEWDAMGILRELTKYKLVFLEEAHDLHQTTLTLNNYRLACDNGRGGIFFAIARGRVSESINLDHHYGRATVVFGLPVLYSPSQIVQARVEYCQTYLELSSQDYWNFDAMRQACKCLANTVRSPLTDYSILVLADVRYNHKEKKSKLPSYLGQPESMSTDHAVQQIRTVLRHMGQPIPQPVVQRLLLTREDILNKENGKAVAPITTSSAIDPVKSEEP